MAPAVDTNILVYAEGHGDAQRCAQANALMARLSRSRVVLPVQVLGELAHVLQRRFKRPAAEVQVTVERWLVLHGAADSSAAAFEQALAAVAEHGLPVWDALILAVAAEQRCPLLISEDFQHGFSWQGVTVVNPFALPLHPRLARLLS